jgi:hypothetical protein
MAWSWIQMLVLLLFLSYLFGNIAKIGSPNMFIYGAFIFLTVYALTDLMDKNFSAIFWEGIRVGVGIYIIFQQGDWFGANAIAPFISNLLIVYFFCSIVVTIWFALEQRKEEKQRVSFT